MNVKQELLAFGFMRNYIKIKAPKVIIKLMAIWINLYDEWSVDLSDDKLMINNGLLLEKDHVDVGWIYGYGSNIVYNGQCHEWIFRFDQKQMNNIKLGIIDVNDVSKQDFGQDQKFGFNCYNFGVNFVCTPILLNCGKRSEWNYLSSLGNGWDNNYLQNGFMIKMILDLSNKTNGILKFYFGDDVLNNEDLKNQENESKYIAFKDIDINREYTLVLGLAWGKYEISILQQ